MIFSSVFWCYASTANVGALFSVANHVSGTISLTGPVTRQVVQRLNGVGSINIAGSASNGPHRIQARFNGGNWETLGQVFRGSFSVDLADQPTGQGTLEVRCAYDHGETASVTLVGVGDVYVIAGQSNASGRADNAQSYTHATLDASLFGNNYLWSDMLDPTDSISGQVDTVSEEITTTTGSVWPLLASFILADGVPVAFIPCAKGGASITDWIPGGDHFDRATLYGSMAHRATNVGGVKAILLWEGETDALASMSQATYYGHFTNFTQNVFTDLGVKVMPCKLQTCSGIPDVDEARINAAIGQAWASDSNTLTGPDLTGLNSDDSFHLTTNQNLTDAAALWWTALEAALYP